MYRMWRSPTCWHAGRWRCSRAGPHGGVALAFLAALHGYARQDLLVPELALGTLHPVRCPHGAERRTHVEGVTVVRVGREAGSREGVVAERAVDWNTDTETGEVSVTTRGYKSLEARSQQVDGRHQQRASKCCNDCYNKRKFDFKKDTRVCVDTFTTRGGRRIEVGLNRVVMKVTIK